MIITKFLRTPILKNFCERLLWIKHVLHKYKAEETEVISRLLITFVTHKLQKYFVEIFCLKVSNAFWNLFHDYDVKALENIHPIIFPWDIRSSYQIVVLKNNTYSTHAQEVHKTVCNFQSMKTPVELNSLLSKVFCYITWLDATMNDLQTRALRQILLFLWNNSLTV